MKRLCTILIIFLISLNVHAEKSITCSTEAWPPYMGPKLPQKGFLTEVNKHAFEKMGYTVKVEFIPWSRAMHKVKNGISNCLQGVYFNDERAKFLIYTKKPILHTKDSLFALKSKKIRFKKLNELKKYNIGILQNSLHGKEFDNAKFLKRDMNISYTQLIRKLIHGRIDLMAGPTNVLLSYFKENFKDDLAKIEILDPPLSSNAVFIAVSKKSPNSAQVAKDLEKGLEKITKDGTVKRLAKKHGIKL